MWAIQDFLRGKSVGVGVGPIGVGSGPVCDFEFNQELVWQAIQIISSRTARVGYRKDVNVALRTPREPLKDGPIDETRDKVSPFPVLAFLFFMLNFAGRPAPLLYFLSRCTPRPHDASCTFSRGAFRCTPRPQVFSVEEYVTALAEEISKEKGGVSPEIDSLQKYGFFTKKLFPYWYMCVLDQVSLNTGRDFNPLCLKGVEGQELPSWDAKRLLSEVKKEDFLWRLICEPIKKMLEDLGLVRDVGVCALLLSLERLIAVLQGYHADTDPTLDWKDGFALSVILAGPEGAYLDLYPGSFDSGIGPKGKPVRVHRKIPYM